ncbi:MAG TPA: hypothetical protein VF526_02705 [Solirubrobacteraceae bacterium]
MEDALGTLIWVVAAVAAVIAIFTLAATGRSYRAIGGAGPATGDEDGSPAVAAERDEEIRQMLEARNARRERRGEARWTSRRSACACAQRGRRDSRRRAA